MGYSLALDMLLADKDLKLPIARSAFSLLTRVRDFLAERGIRSYLIGGFVRDVLLRRDTADIDIAVTGDAVRIAPEVAVALGGRYVLLDEVNRVGRVAVPGHEAPPAGGHWQIDFATVKGDIGQDLGRRDFTVNAMAVDLADLGQDYVQLIDPFGGRDDLHRGVIRVVAETALTSDPVRLLRAVRLAAELGFTIDRDTERLIRRYSHLIAQVAAERLREELLRLLAQKAGFLGYLDRLELLTAIIPELAQLKGATQPREHFWDVFDHSLETVSAVDFLLRQGALDYATDQVRSFVPWSPALAEHFAREVSRGSTRRSLLKLAALIHDIAKPQTRAVDENSRVRFLGHAKQGALVAVSILQRLRFSTREVKLVEIMVTNHLRPGQMGQGQLPTRRAIYRYFRDAGEAGVDTLFLNLADHLAARGPHLDLTGWQEHAQVISYILAQRRQQESLVVPTRLVDGHDLLNILGLRPGPRIGELLESVREAQATGEVSTREEALSYLRRRLTDGQERDNDGV